MKQAFYFPLLISFLKLAHSCGPLYINIQICCVNILATNVKYITNKWSNHKESPPKKEIDEHTIK